MWKCSITWILTFVSEEGLIALISKTQKSQEEDNKMASFAQQGKPATRAALCIGDPDAFASEMIKMINDKEYRLVLFDSMMSVYL